ncbi:hypothetical protein ACOACQ_17375 [Nocardioides sp. CPCC 206347]|uniref:hypothetical protein n=2 Tax=Nocardioides TaxID=1839 RepID=UPI003B42FECD
MTNELAVPVWLAVATLVALVALAWVAWNLNQSLRRVREETDEVLASTARDADELRVQLGDLDEALKRQAALSVASSNLPDRVPVAVVDDREYLITDLHRNRGPQVPARIVPAPMFADILLRESVIKTAALASGLRRALSPEVRNRIRFEMKREIKRSRKGRKLMLKAARRDWETRQRAGVEGPS